jgi:flagellar P-ring protein precursor FlgI
VPWPRPSTSAKGDGTAQALDGRVVQVRARRPERARPSWPTSRTCRSSWPPPARKVVLNARTGSVVLNQAVTLGACAVAHGNLSVTISSTPVVSQPNAAVAGARPWWREGRHRHQAGPGILIRCPPGPQLADVVKALNALGATPQDLLAILQAIKAPVP